MKNSQGSYLWTSFIDILIDTWHARHSEVLELVK